MRGKMSPVRMLLLKHHRPERPTPGLGRERQIAREPREAEWYVRDVLSDGGAVVVRRVGDFVVDARAGGGAGGREPVYWHPCQDLVGCPGVVVCPVVEFFVDPGEEGGGAVGEAVAEGLGLGALDLVVAAAFLLEPLGPG